MRKDRRIFIKIDVDMPDHPKFAGLSKAQKWGIVEALCHCRKYKTDGVIQPAAWRAMATKRDRDAILATGFAIEVKGGVPSELSAEFRQDFDKILTEFRARTGGIVPENCVVFLHYGEHQQTRAEIEMQHEMRSSAGKKGGFAKAKNAAGEDDSGLASATANAYHVSSKKVAEKEEEKDKEGTYVPSASHVSDAHASEAPPRSEADVLDRPTGQLVPIDGRKLVRETVRMQLPSAVQTALALEASAMLKQGIPEQAIRQGLEAWAVKPNVGPKILPSLVADALKAAAEPAPGTDLVAVGQSAPTGWRPAGNAGGRPGVGKPTSKAMGYVSTAEALAAAMEGTPE